MAKMVKLPKEMKEEITRQLRVLHDLLPELDEAEACGVDCTQRRELVNQTREQLERMKAKYART